MKDLQKLRKKLDRIDDEIINLLGKRTTITEEVAHFKIRNSLSLRDKTREAEHLERVENQAGKAGVDAKLARNIIQAIMDEAHKNHERIAKGNTHDV